MVCHFFITLKLVCFSDQKNFITLISEFFYEEVTHHFLGFQIIGHYIGVSIGKSEVNLVMTFFKKQSISGDLPKQRFTDDH